MGPCVQALLFRPSGGRTLWDQEGLVVNGTWYMWYDNNFCADGKPGAGISNYGLATSSDGVQWADQGISMSPWGVNPCNESTGFNASIPVAGIGSGSCWEDPSEEGKYIINYSENIDDSPFGQQIRFSTSRDLKTWTPAADVPSFHEDNVHYAKGRWDTVVQFTDKQKLMHGWWTATPKSAPPPLAHGVATAAFGYGTSTDGLRWTLQPPAWVVLPKGMPGSKQIECGGVAQLPNGKWYGQACAISWGHIGNLGGCFSVVSDAPGGPFVLQARPPSSPYHPLLCAPGLPVAVQRLDMCLVHNVPRGARQDSSQLVSQWRAACALPTLASWSRAARAIVSGSVRQASESV